MSNIYHCQWLPILEYFTSHREYIKPVWVRYKNESGNYDMAMAFYDRNCWREEYSRKQLKDVTHFMELPMMPMKKEWRVFGTDEIEVLNKSTIQAFLNKIENQGWNIHSFVTRMESTHPFVVSYRYVTEEEEKGKGISPTKRIEMDGEDS